MDRDLLTRLARAGAATALVDFAFASALGIAYGSTATRVWQGVASTLLGPGAMAGGTRTAAIGVLMHVGVALWWSAVFVLGLSRLAPVRRMLASNYGIVKVAALYGPCIWLVMSLVVIPALTGRPPTFSTRWWINLAAHVPFVAIPMIWASCRSGWARVSTHTAPAHA